MAQTVDTVARMGQSVEPPSLKAEAQQIVKAEAQQIVKAEAQQIVKAEAQISVPVEEQKRYICFYQTL